MGVFPSALKVANLSNDQLSEIVCSLRQSYLVTDRLTLINLLSTATDNNHYWIHKRSTHLPYQSSTQVNAWRCPSSRMSRIAWTHQTFYCLYISKTNLPCVFAWAACGSDVIVTYDVEH